MDLHEKNVLDGKVTVLTVDSSKIFAYPTNVG